MNGYPSGAAPDIKDLAALETVELPVRHREALNVGSLDVVKAIEECGATGRVDLVAEQGMRLPVLANIRDRRIIVVSHLRSDSCLRSC